jgi:hypothetical protein
MAALEASVAAAKAGRAAGAPEPMVAPARGKVRKPVAVGPGKTTTEREPADDQVEVVPARRRKSA